MPTTKRHTLFTVYLGVVSLISFIGLAIAIMIFTHKIISINIISDDEYTSQNNREMDRCDEPIYLGDDKREIKTEIEKTECITKAKNTLLLQRNLNTKETLLSAGLRTIILLIIFPLHFLYFRKSNKQD